MTERETTLAVAPSAEPFPQWFVQVALVMGGGIAALALGAELVGVTILARSPFAQTALTWLGVTLAAVGVLVDVTVGPGQVLAGLRARLLEADRGLKFVGITLQLGVLVLISQQFHVENVAFYHNVMVLTFSGFVIHYFLPQPSRLPFFVLLSLGCLAGVVGMANAGWIVGLGGGLVGICHLPLPFSLRLVLLLVAGAVLTGLRVGVLPSPWPAALWPLIGSFFLFRLIVYFYDLKHQKAPGGVWHTLAYFFLLPNVAFPLFPVVDYSTLWRTYYNGDEYRIYQRGIKWMGWGVLQLLLYRVIYY
jgi:hypothetical protein